MPKIYVNGKVREMTAEEIAEMEQLTAQIPEEVKDDIAERLEKLEKLFDKVKVLLGVRE